MEEIENIEKLLEKPLRLLLEPLGKPPVPHMLDINAIREGVVTEYFANHIGRRALLMICPYPFLIIGKILEVCSDYLVIEAEVTNIAELDNEIFRVHIDEIEVFYIEDKGKRIPDIRINHL